MNKDRLRTILSSEYNADAWREVLRDVFGVSELRQRSTQVPLPTNNLADAGFELGSFETADGRLVGLYQIDLTDKPRIWQNRVGLRLLLRNIYKYDVDAALVVFVQNDKWRLSLISEIRVLDPITGQPTDQKTEPKRFTYLLGLGERTKTPTDRIASLVGKAISLDDIRTAFSVEALNKEFYQKVSAEFYKLVGATTGKAGKTTVHEKVMQLPDATETTAANRRLHQEFAVRLIGRTVFCWFLKKKESDDGVSLLSESLLSSDAVRKNKDYYHSVLEPLFFQTLNTPTDKRINDLPPDCKSTPFLNGGLFEPQADDFYNSESKTGYYQNFALKIPDSWFLDFFEKLEQYNFTIDENSPTEVEISVDPEMLGRIFENLLAEIDPDSGETARKATGSFYTPREIVNYMVEESLLIYLKSKLQTESFGFQAFGENQPTFFGNEMRIQQKLELPLSNNRWQGKESELETVLRSLFAYGNDDNPFNETETEILIRGIDECKILDPACGSGAFPMGILHRLVFLLDKLDKNNSKWKQWQKQKAIEETKTAFDEGDVNQREMRLLEINSAFEKDSSDFGRKLFLIENCIYGVDIQPIAAEISKLRCFLTLIVDEDVVDNKPNRNVKPLPNLEFKFVTADALLKLPPLDEQRGFFSTDSHLLKLEQIRHDYIQSYANEKLRLKDEFHKIQDQISVEQIKNFKEKQDERASKLSSWDPFGHKAVDWFDPQWMFGVYGFDIVIGNPPYVQMQKDGGLLAKKYAKETYETFERTGDIYSLFYERGIQVLKDGAIITFITSNKWMRAVYGKSLRKHISQKSNPLKLIDFGQTMIFQSAIVHSNILISQKEKNGRKTETVQFEQDLYKENLSVSNYFNQHKVVNSELSEGIWTIVKNNEFGIKEKVEKVGTPLKKWNLEFNRGILTGYNAAFILDGRTKSSLISKDSRNADIIKPILRGRDTRKYHCNFSDYWLINTHNGLRRKGIKRVDVKKDFPTIYEYLLQFKNKAEKRLDKGDDWTNLRNCAYLAEIEKPKIVFSEIVSEPQFHYDTKGFYPEATVFFITGERLKYLIALLNSMPITYFFRTFYAGGELVGKYRYKKAFLETLPIPIPTREQETSFSLRVDQILELKNANPTADTVTLESEIDRLVYKLYDLTDDEIAIIEGR